ncbi:MAG TPA: DUF1190 domain-containing protein [Beijerinckiaceae bacterium]|nr:DUF1190 domain-containing protein [Beijerinckiaceae bacterium]
MLLVAGAGVAAVGLARHDPSQREEDTLIYRSTQHCIDARQRSPGDCRAAYDMARSEHGKAAPRYEAKEDCERHHGRGGCQDAALPGQTTLAFVPALAGYMMGRTAAQNLPVQPLYRHVEKGRDEERHAGGGSGGVGGVGYCTGSGARVAASGGGTSARVASAVARESHASPRSIPRGGSGIVVARGGFGTTGHGISSHGSGS